jgi:hypothetical protein
MSDSGISNQWLKVLELNAITLVVFTSRFGLLGAPLSPIHQLGKGRKTA